MDLALDKTASQIRRDIVRMVAGASSGHPGGSLGCADFLTVLYFDVMNIDPRNFDMDGMNEDIFYLSNGHISPVWYSVLARRGYFPVNELSTFRKLSSRLQGHPSTDKGLPGVRMASGSLGQGLSVAIGTAEAKKLIISKYLESHQYQAAYLFDDSMDNIRSFLQLKKVFPKIRIIPKHVDDTMINENKFLN